METLVQLFITFFKIGAFSFGGGYGMLPLIQVEIVNNHGWLSIGEFLDVIAISQMTPGPIAINSSTFVGFKIAGVSGALVSTFAVVLPSFVLMLLVAHKSSKYMDTLGWKKVFSGIRPAVIGLIGASAFVVARSAIVDFRGVLVAIFVVVGILRFKIHPIVMIVICSVLGVFIF